MPSWQGLNEGVMLQRRADTATKLELYSDSIRRQFIQFYISNCLRKEKVIKATDGLIVREYQSGSRCFVCGLFIRYLLSAIYTRFVNINASVPAAYYKGYYVSDESHKVMLIPTA